MKVSCPKCKKIHKIDEKTAILCGCNCAFGLNKKGKPEILNHRGDDIAKKRE
ncbi:hypothetical protein CLOBY_27380 [Clostridium saccharobutylicum]|uniref:hypothetical protein n=1 Tax=Clostridium saccharobutylicum TaxID=169679 RepID=UPI000983E7E3|nr:hypothetical protein [Clostridium saccharobutylicum]AQS10593.1 hypothetical protein CLOBY_27380 [Clostridium saccharobutylicum]MBC2438054.1 hypothetical protein [Clostridium saccharobutylicum]NSB90493.1 hypothetical protein [Clostridium saccharobutylicum]NYC31548.1 hypothetical protein [Clostridium saccharobutylicum]OOM18866.1 hypothetical protein CLSAB_03240 [Clostridium saccharobutylicum]